MTQKEFLDLKKGMVIRYTGKKKKILDIMSLKLQEEGITVYFTRDYAAVIWGAWNAKRGLSIRHHGKDINNITPANWERNLVKEARLDKQKAKRKVKRDVKNNKADFERAKENVPYELDNIEIIEFLDEHKHNVDTELEDLQLHQKMEIFNKLTRKQKRMLDLLYANREELEVALDKFVKEMTKPG